MEEKNKGLLDQHLGDKFTSEETMSIIRKTLLMYWSNTLFKDWLRKSVFDVGSKASALRAQLKTHHIESIDEEE